MSLLSYGALLLYREDSRVISQLFDTRYRDDDYRREGGREKTGTAAITGAARVTKRKRTREEIPEEERKRKTRGGMRKVHHGRRAGRMGKMREEGNKVKRGKRVGSWPCGYDRRNEREKKKGEGGN